MAPPPAPPLHVPRCYKAPEEPRLGPRPATQSRPPPHLLPSSGGLDLLTEALGAESFDPDDDAAAAPAMEDGAVAAVDVLAPPCKRPHHVLLSSSEGVDHDDDDNQHAVMVLRRTRSGRAFPPPISVIGKGGRPWLSLRAHREAGRLVLREMRLPSQELLQPCKEDGRFKLLIHPEAGRRGGAGAGPRVGPGREGHGALES
uniref:FAF domain-containing protein n=1 Tax=Oryza punctata TaxID=4537 RepID=A0A0E0KQB9_ORYPU